MKKINNCNRIIFNFITSKVFIHNEYLSKWELKIFTWEFEFDLFNIDIKQVIISTIRKDYILTKEEEEDLLNLNSILFLKWKWEDEPENGIFYSQNDFYIFNIIKSLNLQLNQN